MVNFIPGGLNRSSYADTPPPANTGITYHLPRLGCGMSKLHVPESEPPSAATSLSGSSGELLNPSGSNAS